MIPDPPWFSWPVLGLIARATLLVGWIVGGAVAAAGPQPRIEFLYGDGEIYPSALVSVTEHSAFPPRLTYQRGDPAGLLAVVLTAPRDDCPVKVTFAATEVFDESSITVTLLRKGELYRVAPYLVLNHAKILQLKHPIPAEVLRATVEIDGRPVTVTRRVRIHAINDCLMGARFAHKVIDASYLGAAYVNENNPEIPAAVIRRALAHGVQKHGHDRAGERAVRDHGVDRFIGYDGGPATVEREVEAIYHALQDMGFKYAAMLRPSMASDHTASQWIRLSSDSIRSDQANCIDGTIILASVLTRLRLRVVLFILPYQHALMGVYLNPNDQTLDSVLVIETTKLGSDPFAVAKRAGASLLAGHVSALGRRFGGPVRALAELRPADLEAVRHQEGLDRTKIIDAVSLYVVDIQDARLNRGIQPVPELMPGSRWVGEFSATSR